MERLVVPGVAVLMAMTLWVLTPTGAFAAEGSRAVERPEDWTSVMLLTAAAASGVLLLASLGYLYMRLRGIEWSFQRPDPPAGDHH